MSEERKQFDMDEVEGENQRHAQTFFTKMVDELVEFSEHDPQLADGLKWIDAKAQRNGTSFYDEVYKILHSASMVKHADGKAKKWLEDKDDS